MTKILDKPGTRFGKLTLLENVGKNRFGQSLGRYACDCGRETVALASRVRTGKNISCGCLMDAHRATFGRTLSKSAARVEGVVASTAQDITGKRFGRLVAQRPISLGVFKNGRHKRGWELLCDCGKLTRSTAGYLNTGNKQSCGCLQKEIAAGNFKNDGFEAYLIDHEHAARASHLYFVEVDGRYEKFGIAFDVKRRGAGHFTEVWHTRQMPRAYCWAVEQALLSRTLHAGLSGHDASLRVGGTSEIRQGLLIDETIELMDALSDECLRLGWQRFFAEYVPVGT